jgi:hypothetical protein
MEQITDLVNVKPHIEKSEAKIDELDEIRRMLDDDTPRLVSSSLNADFGSFATSENSSELREYNGVLENNDKYLGDNAAQEFEGKYASDKDAESEKQNASYSDIINQTPTSNGNWSGDRGNSVWHPNDEEVLHDLRYYGKGIEGIKYFNGYPDFTPVQVFESRLPMSLYDRNDDYQFTDCNLELLDFLKGHPESISYFDDTQLSEIAKGQNPIGYTWHHDIQSGRMQLVPTSIHRNCSHYGGRNRWGGGNVNR